MKITRRLFVALLGAALVASCGKSPTQPPVERTITIPAAQLGAAHGVVAGEVATPEGMTKLVGWEVELVHTEKDVTNGNLFLGPTWIGSFNYQGSSRHNAVLVYGPVPMHLSAQAVRWHIEIAPAGRVEAIHLTFSSH